MKSADRWKLSQLLTQAEEEAQSEVEKLHREIRLCGDSNQNYRKWLERESDRLDELIGSIRYVWAVVVNA